MRTPRFIVFFVLALVAATLLAACGSTKKNAVPAGAVAIVGSDPITKADLNSLMAQAKAQYAAAKKTFPAIGSKSYQSVQDSALAYLVEQSAYAQQAEKMGIKVTSAEVDSSLAQAIKQNFKGSQKKYEAELKKQHVTEAQVKENIHETLLDNKVSSALTSGVTVSQGEIKKYYDAHKSSYQIGESRAVSHILVKTKAEAESIYRQLKAGANFAKLAKKYSTDSSKSNGGALGVMQKKNLVKPFADVLFSDLKTGTFSKPVHTIYGWHIIEPTGPIVKAHLQTLSEASPTISQTLLTPKQNTAVAAWVKNAQKYAADNTNYAPGYEPATTTSSSTVATTTTS